MKHALKEKIKWLLVKLPSYMYMTNSLCKCGTIKRVWMKLAPFIVKTIATRLGTKANFTAKLHTNRQR